jgi:hypothetical protein
MTGANVSVSVGNELRLLHFESLDEARREAGLSRPCGARAILKALEPPSALQFRLRFFLEHQSTDSGLQGANDEVYLSAIGADSSAVTVGPDRQPAVDLIHAPPIGDVSADEVRDCWRNNPFIFIGFDLRRPGDWPRTYTVTLLIVEHDNGDLAHDFDQLLARVGGKIREAIVNAAAVASAALAGAAIGSAIPGIGTTVGAAVGALTSIAYDELIPAIQAGLADDIFKPIPITLTIAKPWLAARRGHRTTPESPGAWRRL